jgi:hypothetical protein
MSIMRSIPHLLSLIAALFTPLARSTDAQAPSSDTLEITSKRIDQLLDGLKGERPIRERIAKATGAVGQHPGPLNSADVAKMQECGKAEMQRYQAKARADQQGMDPREVERRNREAKKKYDEAAKNSQKRMMEVARSGDAAALQRYQDSLRRSMSSRVNPGGAPECGSLEASASPEQLAQIDQAGAKASGIPLPQYLVLRKRVATYFRTGDAGGYGVTYSKAEKKTFEKRARDLMPYAMMLGSSIR